MCGAISLAATATLRSGSGLVTVATFDHCVDLVASLQPCYMTLPLSTDAHQRLTPSAREQIAGFPADCLACGPGFGRDPEVAELVAWMYRSLPQPLVVDADGINALAAGQVDLAAHAGPRVLTPHPGEYRRLVDAPDLDLEECHRQSQRIAEAHQIVLLVKGHRTSVTDGGRTYRNSTGNPGMATGGVGDVLTGVITALICQGLDAFEAAQLGAYVHGLAGDLAAQQFGLVSLIASDLIDFLPLAFRQLGSPT
jgi:NAD(P)H-hydrate epimerase